jgi:hypothetical protein
MILLKITPPPSRGCILSKCPKCPDKAGFQAFILSGSRLVCTILGTRHLFEAMEYKPNALPSFSSS